MKDINWDLDYSFSDYLDKASKQLDEDKKLAATGTFTDNYLRFKKFNDDIKGSK